MPDVPDWGWRWPFILGILVGVVGLNCPSSPAPIMPEDKAQTNRNRPSCEASGPMALDVQGQSA